MVCKGRHETSARPGFIEDESDIGAQRIEDAEQDIRAMEVPRVVVVKNRTRPVRCRLPLREIDGEMMKAEVGGGQCQDDLTQDAAEACRNATVTYNENDRLIALLTA